MIKTANVAELKDNLSKLLDAVEQGGEVLVCRRNVPFARIVGMPLRKNRTKLGSQRGQLKIVGEVTGPILPESDWRMLQPASAQRK